jgi:hypothetical protein
MATHAYIKQEPSLRRAGALVVWGLFALTTAWLGWRWHAWQGPSIASAVSPYGAPLPTDVVAAIVLPTSATVPTFLPPSTKRQWFLLSSGIVVAAEEATLPPMPRPRLWFLPWVNGLVAERNTASDRARLHVTIVSRHTMATIGLPPRPSTTIQAPVPLWATHGVHSSDGYDTFSGTVDGIVTTLLVTPLSSTEPLLATGKSIVQQMSTQEESRMLPDGSIMHERVQDPSAAVFVEELPSSTAQASFKRIASTSAEWFIGSSATHTALSNNLEAVENYLYTLAWTNTVCSYRVQGFTKHKTALPQDEKQVVVVQSGSRYVACDDP